MGDERSYSNLIDGMYVYPRDHRTVPFTAAEFGSQWALFRARVFKVSNLWAFHEEFRTWLAERERKVAERTWDEAVYHLEAVVGSEMRRQAMRDNPYRREASS